MSESYKIQSQQGIETALKLLFEDQQLRKKMTNFYEQTASVTNVTSHDETIKYC